MYIIKNILKPILNLIAPPFCVACQQWLADDTIFCDKCLQKIRPISSKQLPITKTKSIHVHAISDYQEPLKKLILAKGYSHILASVQLGRLIWNLTNIKHVPFDYIVPVPLHWTRYAWRGFNQAQEIAKVLSANSGKPLITITRCKKTLPQSRFTRPERAQNVTDIFQISSLTVNKIKNKHLLIVDDLMTTGATVAALAKELYKAKPASVTGVVACRVV